MAKWSRSKASRNRAHQRLKEENMKRALLKAGSVAALVGLAAAVGTLPVLAQTPTAQPAAQKAAAATIKRMANGKPDLSGTWTFRLAPTPVKDPRGVCAGPACGRDAGIDPGAPAPA